MSRTLAEMKKAARDGDRFYCQLVVCTANAAMGLVELVEERGHGAGVDIAKQLGCSRSFLHDIINGRRSLSPSMLKKVSHLQ